jgi:hypothetical protein
MRRKYQDGTYVIYTKEQGNICETKDEAYSKLLIDALNMYDQKATYKVLADCLVKDLEMLQDGSWEPDEDSIQASLDNAESIQHYLE